MFRHCGQVYQYNVIAMTEADPLILAKYVAALLKKDKPIKELQNLCAENLVEFLGPGTNSFVTNLFEALEDGSIVSTTKSLDSVEEVEPSSSLATVHPTELNKSSLKTEELSPSGQLSDSEEREISDDDDDDRNHKHRRRETRSQSFEKDVQDQYLRRQNRKRNRPFDNGHMFLESDPQSSGSQKEYNPAPLGTDLSSKFEKRRPGLAPFPRAHFELSQRTRVNQGIRGEGGSRLDLSTPLGRLPIGRGRGRTSGLWSQHDSRFTSVGTLEFASQMAPQGPATSLFAGRGLQNAATTQNTSWGAFGLIPGMPNGGLDALHPLMQGTLRPPINPSLGIGIPRQRCRDFEERGFCLRGDMCPMEHGVNRIVVEDVQSLSQFNLPVSLPSARVLGKPAGSGPLPTVSGPSSLSTNSKGLHGKSSMAGTNGDGLGMNGMLSASASAGEADLYDPDQPLWNNNCPEASSSLLRLSSPKIDDAEPLWNADPSDRQNFRLSDGNGSDFPGRNITTAVGSQGTNSSVWGRIGNSGNKVEATGKNDGTVASMGYLGNETKEDQVEGLPGGSGNVHQRKWTVSEDVGPKAKTSAATSRLQNDPARITERTSQKAQRTLFVNGIPLKSNKKEALLSHFQKFGEVIDIYIPLNSERAFVQFSTREEAESALKAPDAVMGNRFIKLWWANRDSIPENGVSSGKIACAVPRGLTATSIPPQSSSADRGKENIPSVALKVTAMPAPAPETSLPAAVNVRHAVTNGPKDAPSQKKLENLELLKEELRLKQQMLDQKRNDFRRQLDKLEKQAVPVKSESTTQQVGKKHKVEMVTDIAKSATPKPTHPGRAGVRPEVEKMRDKNSLGENLASPSSKTNSTAVLQSARSLMPSSHPSAPQVSPFLVNRFKLDNRPTSFRILPPLPADLVNVAILKEHFSSFGDLSTVELEDAEADTSSALSEPSENRSARITFTTRRSAERAFLNGKCWEDHNLEFLWLTTSSNSSNNSGRENTPTPTAKGLSDAEVLTKAAVSGSSTSSTVKSTPSESEAAATTGNGESVNSEEMKGGIKPMDLVEAHGSSPTTMSSCETQSPKAHNLIHEDGQNVESSQ
ncbi:RNA recognition motif domain [Macleaya cordata]|uniref:RNA recognition motif domain n=1 Tax=Macleaya cordata TaxID=56857 RepID=A0A200RAZ7_MACCD|nr:RNA recognition motif domain [Macleaya cordata]